MTSTVTCFNKHVKNHTPKLTRCGSFVEGLGVLKGEAGMLCVDMFGTNHSGLYQEYWWVMHKPPRLCFLHPCTILNGDRNFSCIKWNLPTGISTIVVFSSSFLCLLFSVIMYQLFFKIAKKTFIYFVKTKEKENKMTMMPGNMLQTLGLFVKRQL